MKVFTIPSWYPSESNPSYGVFIKEQIELLAAERPAWQIGVSTWGQGDEGKLLWARDHIKNVRKVSDHSHDQASYDQIQDNLHVFYEPALAWTKKFKKGNLEGIERACEMNFQAFAAKEGFPDLIWVQATYPGVLLAQTLAKKYTIPYVVHVRLGGYMFEAMLSDAGPMKEEVLNAIESANARSVTSNFQKEELRNWMQGPTDVLHNPVNLEFFSLSEDAGEGVLAIGRLEKEKGFDLLIEAMSKVPDQKLRLGGSGSELKKLKALVSQYDLENATTFLGNLTREEVRAEIQKCSFLVLPSRYETFGNVLLEAMACGKPVIATRCGGPVEIVSGTCGLLCEPAVQDLADQLKQMLDIRDSFDAKGIRAEIEQKFSGGKWIDEVEQLFTIAVSR